MVLPFFKTLINRGLADGTTFSMCTRVRIQEYAMMLYIFCTKIHLNCCRGSNRLVFLLNIIIKVLNLFQFQFISNSKYFN